MLSVIIPASNEAGYIAACLESVLSQSLDPGPGGSTVGGAEVIVAANGCQDDTVTIARGFASRFAEKGWDLTVLDIPQGGKPNALNRADAAARGHARVYLDADIGLDPGILAQIAARLDSPEPCYASGRLRVAPPRTWVTRHFARIWERLPFMAEGVPGAGLFAVNAAARARWTEFPPIISDDTYVRLLFTPQERVSVAAGYDWPMVEGFAALVKVRRRQDAGVEEVARLYPDLMANEGKASLGAAGAARLALRFPVSFAVYVTVLLSARFGRAGDGWSRGR